MRWMRFPTIGFALLAGCATVPQAERLTPLETAALCIVAPASGLSQVGGPSWERDPAIEARLGEYRERIAWKSLPHSIRCPTGRLRLSGPGYGNFIHGFGLSADGQMAGVSVGFLYTPLLGGGGECYFQRDGDSWRALGCRHMWDN